MGGNSGRKLEDQVNRMREEGINEKWIERILEHRGYHGIGRFLREHPS